VFSFQFIVVMIDSFRLSYVEYLLCLLLTSTVTERSPRSCRPFCQFFSRSCSSPKLHSYYSFPETPSVVLSSRVRMSGSARSTLCTPALRQPCLNCISVLVYTPIPSRLSPLYYHQLEGDPFKIATMNSGSKADITNKRRGVRLKLGVGSSH